MKKNLLAMLAMTAAFSASAATQKTFTDREVLTIDSDTTWNGETYQSAIDVSANCRAVINIKKGKTLTVTGGDASGTSPGVAAIYVPENATLYITGEGTLVATGGAAGNGSNGSSGSSGYLNTSDEDGYGGAGGSGGAGGGGGAPAIGGYGGSGGSGGGGGSGTGWRNCEDDEFTASGGNGGNGSSGGDGHGMGRVVILGSVTVQATAGAAATSDGSGGSNGSKATDDGSGWPDAYVSGGGGGGGGGARGQSAQYGIGGGGAGGAGGGGGGGGGTTVEDDRTDYSKVVWGQGGAGGNSYSGSTGGAGSSGGSRTGYASYGTASGGYGGSGGSANTTRGNNGMLEAMSTATLSISGGRTASPVTPLSGSGNAVVDTTVTFYGYGSQTASLAFLPPSAPSAVPGQEGYAFLGYYTAQEGGTQIYDADNNCVYSVWPFVEDMTLYAHWVRLSNLTFISEGVTVGALTAQQGNPPPNAPEATKTDYRFLGYFTEATGGTMVYNSDRYPVENTWNSTEDFTYYALWEPVSVPFTLTLKSEGSDDVAVNARQNTSIASVDVPEKEYYAFTGYWTAATGGTKVFDSDGTPVEATWTRYEDLTLYAQWEPVSVPFTVTLISDGETVGTINARQSFAIESVTPPAKASSMFTGYWTAETGGTKVFDSDGTPVEATWTRYEDLTLYAQWTSAYSFTFVSTDATVGTGVYVDGDTQTAPVPVRSGDYAFQGYYTEATGGERIFDENGARVGSLSGLSPDTTLYAQWAVPEGSIAKLVYRGQLNLLTGVPATSETSYTKKMHFRVYDSSEATTPLWSVNDQQVTVNADGSFVHMFGNEDLAALIATGKVTHVGLAIGDSANLATELKPRRELRPVAAVNRALTAEGAALDIRVGNLVTENALVAADATVSHLEVAGTVNAYGAGKVSVSPLVVGAEERTRLLRGGGVKVFARANPTELTLLSSAQGTVSRGQEIAVAPSDGVALISCKAGGERALRCPAVIQYCKKDDKVRSPTYIEGGVRVTFFPFIGKEGR